ncbi:hypothetical protein D3C80_1515520 [compost metagenome]
MNDMYYFSMRHMNRKVRVHTCDGRCYEGYIAGVDNQNIYLQTNGGVRTSGKAYTSQWLGFGGGLLTLSLFTLLAIALI